MILLSSLAILCVAACDMRPFKPSARQWIPFDRPCCAWLNSIDFSYHKPRNTIPRHLIDSFLTWNTTILQEWFFNERYMGANAMQMKWPAFQIDSLVSAFKNGIFSSENYPGAASLFLDALKISPVSGLRGAVIGSETPWIEALFLSQGAEHITTVEYGKIETDHPKLTTMTIDQFQIVSGALRFDFVVSYSSLEHSGLGRYGDSLQPFGDLEWIERIRCILKPNGILFFGAPIGGVDCLVFNAHRIYGPNRLKYVKRGFETLGMFGVTGTTCSEWDKQPVLVLKME